MIKSRKTIPTYYDYSLVHKSRDTIPMIKSRKTIPTYCDHSFQTRQSLDTLQAPTVEVNHKKGEKEKSKIQQNSK